MVSKAFINVFSIVVLLSCYNALHACYENVRKDCAMCSLEHDFGTTHFDQDIVCTCTGTRLYDGQLALASSDGSCWEPVVVYENFAHECQIPAHHCRTHTRIDYSRTMIRALKPYWQWILQKRPPRGIMRDVWLNYLKSIDDNAQPHLNVSILSNAATVHVVGDLHADIDSLLVHVNRFKELNLIDDDGVIEPNQILVFLGDYTDRGSYGANVWYVLMHLALLNPGRVLLLRGNHESMPFAEQAFLFDWASWFAYGLSKEEQRGSLENLYKSLPCGALMGFKCSDEKSLPQIFRFLLLCHAGIDETVPLSSAMDSIIDTFKVKGYCLSKFYFAHPDITKSGLLWSDFHARETEHEQALFKPSVVRGYGFLTYNSLAAREFIVRCSKNSPECVCSLYGIVDGHEHIPGGINRLRDVVSMDKKSWVPLDSMATYTICLGDVFTCVSSSRGLARFNCKEDASAVIRCREDGTLQLTPFIVKCAES